MLPALILTLALAAPAQAPTTTAMCDPALSDCPGTNSRWWPGTAPDIQPQAQAPRAVSRPAAKRKRCGTWWVKGRDAHGHGGKRRGHRGVWHIEKGCRWT